MDLIILNDGLYSLVPVTKAMLEHIKLFAEVDCFDLCVILLRLDLLTYYRLSLQSTSLMKDGSGDLLWMYLSLNFFVLSLTGIISKSS